MNTFQLNSMFAFEILKLDELAVYDSHMNFYVSFDDVFIQLDEVKYCNIKTMLN